MPIFEYGCETCGTSFELLVRSDTKVSCPGCGGETLKKKLSLFASHVAHPSGALPSCHSGEHGCDLGRCGSGSCGVD
jgi:putative FmdB family regulatory protein